MGSLVETTSGCICGRGDLLTGSRDPETRPGPWCSPTTDDSTRDQVVPREMLPSKDLLFSPTRTDLINRYYSPRVTTTGPVRLDKIFTISCTPTPHPEVARHTQRVLGARREVPARPVPPPGTTTPRHGPHEVRSLPTRASSPPYPQSVPPSGGPSRCLSPSTTDHPDTYCRPSKHKPFPGTSTWDSGLTDPEVFRSVGVRPESN